jgi:septum formation protein
VHPESGLQVDGVETSTVVFRPLSAEEIGRSIASGEPFGKAGAYAIQGGARAFVERLDGALDNVVGLPLALVRSLLDRLAAAVERAR